MDLCNNNYVEIRYKGYFDILLGWSSKWNRFKEYSDDLDLCVFYKTKTGKSGGIYSNTYNQKKEAKGALAEFPFIFLISENRMKQEYDNEEILRIANIHEMEEIFIVAIDYNASIEGKTGFNQPITLETIGTNPLVTINYSRKKGEHGTILILASLKESDNALVITNKSLLLSMSDSFERISGFNSIVTP